MQKRQATKTIASPVFADCRRVGIETAGEVGREPFPSRRPGSMTARRSLASRQASEPEIILRDVPRPPHVGTSYSNPWSMPGPQKLCVARAVFCFRFQLSHMVYYTPSDIGLFFVIVHLRAGGFAHWRSRGQLRGRPPTSSLQCSGAGRVGSSVGSVGDALLLWCGPHRRAAEVALLAPLGGARRSREWSAWATTGAAVRGQATLPPRPTWGGVGHNSVLTRGRPSWLPRSKREIAAWDRAEPGPPTAQ